MPLCLIAGHTPNLQFVAPSNVTSAVLNSAFQRYTRILFDLSPMATCAAGQQGNYTVQFDITGTSGDRLDSTTDESYTLTIKNPTTVVLASSVYGALHALESLAQLVQRSANGTAVLPLMQVIDFPRFAFRGFLHDTSRHFLSVKVLKKLIDALSASKFNVFHWHIVDDQSFPYVSSSLPNLSKGSWGGLASHTYSQKDVQDIIQYAKERGVRVVPEFDTPGHTASWGVGYPDVVTPCYTGTKPNGAVGPLNPTLPSTFQFLQTLYRELNQVFPDDYIHMGGDEVSFGCWQSNPAVQKWMASKNWTDYALLEQFYEQSLIQIVQATGKHYVVWQEIFDNGLKVDSHTIVDVWKGENWQSEMQNVTKAGYQVILSAPWYLNYTPNPYGPMAGGWEPYYIVEPTNFSGTPEQKALVIGGEGCMWGEYSDNSNVISNTWPRAAAVGERLWSPMDTTDIADAKNRLQDFSCELARRGVQSSPFAQGPSYCLFEYNSE